MQQRKMEHLAICTDADVEARRSTLLEDVQLLHDSLPEASLEDVDLSTSVLGRRLSLPLVISGMTGGTAEAGRINRALARAAQHHGLAMGVGSQRPMLVDPSTAASYRVRHVAPDVLLFANLGAVQARDAGPAAVADLVGAIGADALSIHLNPAQELVQEEGDRDFRGCVDAIAELVGALPVPVVAKETGCGLGPRALSRLRDAGVEWVDVAGAGGTTWTGVEALRGPASQRSRGEALREWGIPTAASLLYARRAGMQAIASGGLRNGLDVARALALGAEAAALALPFLRALRSGGDRALSQEIVALGDALRSAALLTGSLTLEDLRSAPRVLGGRLRAWLDVDSSCREKIRT